MRRKRIITICMTIVLFVMVFLQGCGKAADEQSVQIQSENTGSTNDNIDNDTNVIETNDDGDYAGNNEVDDKSNTDDKAGDASITDKSDDNKDGSDNNDTNVTNAANVAKSAKDSENIITSKESAEPDPYETVESAGTAYPSTAGALHVDGTQLKDSHGNAIQLKGISTHGLAWFPGYVNEDCFR